MADRSQAGPWHAPCTTAGTEPDAAGIFTGDKYVEPHQIGTVEGDTVHLTLDKDAIEKPA